jgi:Spx/MgsR family transcriptional regulator
MVVLFGIRNCDTCRKAWKWLEQNGVEYRFHDFRRDGIDRETVDRWMDAVGDARLVNRRGRTWRDLDPDARDALDEEALRDLLTNQPALIKRPVVDWPDGELTVGFDPAQWAKRR